ncbi:MAG: TlpA family protein disulfide reductase [Marinilabiliaceae bacterium]|nr:TlpA family protein disulfide reductase [Marinilabiliaceae bacterium]
MLSEDLLRTICDEKKTLNPNELSFITKQITSSFIIEYINRCNEQTIADIAYRKANPLCHVNEVSNVEDENVFETIIKKYEGKVVYVDFWATWCGPCRTGIERIAPLKEEMVNDDVVFVYITGDSSPQGTWANMIPNIRGEHYRLTKSQWKFLGDKYKISGIPRCMMIDKQGKMVNDNLGHLQNDVIKQMLLEQIVK